MRSRSQPGGVPARTFTARSTSAEPSSRTSASPWWRRSCAPAVIPSGTPSVGMGVGAMVVVSVVVVTVVVRVEVRLLRQPHLVLEARQRDPVHAAVAVHPQIALDGLL